WARMSRRRRKAGWEGGESGLCIEFSWRRAPAVVEGDKVRRKAPVNEAFVGAGTLSTKAWDRPPLTWSSDPTEASGRLTKTLCYLKSTAGGQMPSLEFWTFGATPQIGLAIPTRI
ncbi:MAG: hypothetical protein ACK44Q_17820, partial [Pirellulaceae bacterium]